MMKAYAVGLCAALVAATAVAVPAAEAQTERPYVTTPKRVANAQRPRARVTVAPRSFLDAGTEVKPGERKFTDYAFPAGNAGFGISSVTNTGGRVGWATDPFIPWPQLGGFNRW
jgi:ABC-type amino acid transport substrate-binding protein